MHEACRRSHECSCQRFLPPPIALKRNKLCEFRFLQNEACPPPFQPNYFPPHGPYVFNEAVTAETYTLPLHDSLPIFPPPIALKRNKLCEFRFLQNEACPPPFQQN